LCVLSLCCEIPINFRTHGPNVMDGRVDEIAKKFGTIPNGYKVY